RAAIDNEFEVERAARKQRSRGARREVPRYGGAGLCSIHVKFALGLIKTKLCPVLFVREEPHAKNLFRAAAKPQIQLKSCLENVALCIAAWRRRNLRAPSTDRSDDGFLLEGDRKSTRLNSSHGSNSYGIL